MPVKNSIKQFVADGYYHLYNRGVEKRKIFEDDQDYVVFCSYLRTYLLPKDTISLERTLADPTSSSKEKSNALQALRLNNFSEEIALLAFIQMPNHFHFLVKQTEATSIAYFMKSLCSRYTGYFNKKYRRVGPLLQSVYKAVLITSDEHLLYLTRYIHRNCLALKGETLRSYIHSSYHDYIGNRPRPWVKPQEILNYFSKEKFNSYVSFVSSGEHEETSARLLSNISLDSDT